MKYKRLGKTGLEVSAIGFGAIKLSGVTQETATATINRELDLGVNFIDTARAYGDSERKIGIATEGRRDEFYLATKTNTRTADGARKDLETSLKELDMEKVDLWQLHTVSDRATWDKVMGPGGALEATKWAWDEGLADHIGITIHRDIGVMKDAITCGEFETIMLAYSIIDNENVEPEVLPLAKEHDVGVIIMKPLCGGALVSPRAEGEPKVPVDPIVRGNLRYIISNPAVSVAIPGIRTLEEVEENCAVGDSLEPLTAAEKDQFMKDLGSLGMSFRYGQSCLRCGYCQPCPNEIDIPKVFRALDEYQGYPDNLKYIGLETYKSLDVKPDACAECRECMEKCPTGMDIPERLKEAQRIIEEAIAQMGA
jgi:predicted aldo/keto reductase-like oxidoreductase